MLNKKIFYEIFKEEEKKHLSRYAEELLTKLSLSLAVVIAEEKGIIFKSKGNNTFVAHSIYTVEKTPSMYINTKRGIVTIKCFSSGMKEKNFIAFMADVTKMYYYDVAKYIGENYLGFQYDEETPIILTKKEYFKRTGENIDSESVVVFKSEKGYKENIIINKTKEFLNYDIKTLIGNESNMQLKLNDLVDKKLIELNFNEDEKKYIKAVIGFKFLNLTIYTVLNLKLKNELSLKLTEVNFILEEKDMLYKKQLRKTHIPEVVQNIFPKICELSTESVFKNIKIKEYLYNRGFDDSSIRNLKIGYISEELSKYLVDNYKESLAGAGLITYNKFCFNERIIIPSFDKNGYITSIAGRDTVDFLKGIKSERKYDFRSFNADGIKDIYIPPKEVLDKTQHNVIFLTETRMDAGLLSSFGIKTFSYDQMCISDNIQIKTINKILMEEMILNKEKCLFVQVPDNDNAGKEGMAKNYYMINKGFNSEIKSGILKNLILNIKSENGTKKDLGDLLKEIKYVNEPNDINFRNKLFIKALLLKDFKNINDSLFSLTDEEKSIILSFKTKEAFIEKGYELIYDDDLIKDIVKRNKQNGLSDDI